MTSPKRGEPHQKKVPTSEELNEKLRLLVNKKINSELEGLNDQIESFLRDKIHEMITHAMGFTESFGRLEIRGKSPLNNQVKLIADEYVDKCINENRDRLLALTLSTRVQKTLEKTFLDTIEERLEERIEAIAEEHIDREVQTMIRNIVGKHIEIKVDSDD